MINYLKLQFISIIQQIRYFYNILTINCFIIFYMINSNIAFHKLKGVDKSESFMDFLVDYNCFGMYYFFSLSILLWNRNVDATGALQTLEIKLLNILVLGAFFLIPAIIQLIWCIVNIIKVKESNKSNN